MKVRTVSLWAVLLTFSLGLLMLAGSTRGGDDDAAKSAEKAEKKAEREAGKAEKKAEREKAKDAKEADESNKDAKEIDKRQDNQAKRIEQGIDKGYLTAEEIGKLDAQQKSIAALEISVKADGKLSKDDFKQLQTELDKASRCIWAEKHNTDGKQMPTYRLGKDVFAKNDLTSKLADENLSAADAKALLGDFRRTVELKRKLASENLSSDERSKLQDEYNTLLNKYFELR